MRSNKRRLCKLPPIEEDKLVQNSLAVTPAQMWELQKQGIPISAQSSGLAYDDGEYKVDWDVPLEHRRGIDPADIWESERTIQSKVNTAFSKIFGKKDNPKSPDNA